MNAAGEPDRPVQHYVITRGQVAPSRTLRLETVLIASRSPEEELLGHRATCSAAAAHRTAAREELALLAWCRRPLSIAEAAARLHLPVSVVTVVAARLIDTGHLAVHAPATRFTGPDVLTDVQWKQLLDGLQSV